MWKVKWSDVASEFARKVLISESNAPIKAYFEDNEKILAFIRIRGQVLYVQLDKPSVRDVVGFKLEYLSDAFELQENPLNRKPLEIVTKRRLQ